MSLTNKTDHVHNVEFAIECGDDQARVERDGMYVRLEVSDSDTGRKRNQLFAPEAAREIALALLLAADRHHIEIVGDSEVSIRDANGALAGNSAITTSINADAVTAQQYLSAAIGINNLKNAAIDTTDHEAMLVELIKTLKPEALKRLGSYASTL